MFIGNLSTFNEEKTYLPKGYEKWIQYLAELDLDSLELGRYELDEENYMIVAEKDTDVPTVRRLEAHRKFADIQLVIDGKEKMGYQSIKQMDSIREKESSDEKDIYFYDSKFEDTVITMTKGTYAILLPSDVHRTSCNWGNESERVKKIIMKIKL